MNQLTYVYALVVRYIDIRDGVRPSPNHHDHFAPAPAFFRPGFGIPALGGDLSRCMSPPPSECTMEAGSGGISTTKKNIVSKVIIQKSRGEA